MEMLGLDDQPRMSLKLLKKERELGELGFSSLDIWDANTAKNTDSAPSLQIGLFNLVIYLIK